MDESIKELTDEEVLTKLNEQCFLLVKECSLEDFEAMYPGHAEAECTH